MKRRKDVLTLVFGLIAALVILTGQFNYYPAQVKALMENSKEDDTDGKDSSSKRQKEELKIFLNDAVSSIVQFSFQQVLHFIANVYSETIESTKTYLLEKVSPIVYFETLFKRIISPNAP